MAYLGMIWEGFPEEVAFKLKFKGAEYDSRKGRTLKP